MWRCDACGQPIENVQNGWVEWVTYDDAGGVRRARDLRLVHQDHLWRSQGLDRHCQSNGQAEYAKDGGIVGDGELKDFLGPDGLTSLLELLGRDTSFERMDVIRLIMRLHIPGYERARPHFVQAQQDGVVEPNMAPEFHWQADIERINREYGS